jgi:putative addiction module CopG family antidote
MLETFPPDVVEFVRGELASGAYSDENAIVTEGLRSLQALRTKHNELKAEVQERIRRARAGVSTPIDWAAFKDDCARRFEAEMKQS